MKKKYFWVIVVISIILSLVSFLVWDELETNIRRYSVYYAKHIPHGKDTDPVLAMTMENLDHLDKPERSDYRYDFDGNNSVIVDENTDLSEISEGYLLGYFQDRERLYSFNTKGEFVPLDSWDTEYQRDDKSELKKQKAYNLAYTILQPIIDIQPTPDTNFQWYFNWKYQKRFE